MRPLLFALALSACVTPPEIPAVTAAPIVAAERAFAAEGAGRGWAAAFRAWHAPDALVLSPGPISAAESLAAVPGDGETTLDWRPAFAGIARSGEFGFTTGPFLVRGRDGAIGHYFTVWRRQPDGAWKWIFDAGTGVADSAPVSVDFAVPELPVSAEGRGDGAIAEIEAVEHAHGSPELLSALVAADGRVNRTRAAQGIGAAGAALMRADGAIAYTSLRREASEAGDMVFSFGEARDVHEGAARLQYFARIWQLRREGWRIVFDEIVPHRAPPAG